MAKNFPPRGAGTEEIVTTGGDRVISVPKNATTVIEAVPGRLCKAVVTTAGTDSGAVQFFDDSATAQGTQIAAIPGTVAVGAIFDFQMPFKNGCVCVNPANGPVLAVSVIVNG